MPRHEDVERTPLLHARAAGRDEESTGQVHPGSWVKDNGEARAEVTPTKMPWAAVWGLSCSAVTA